MVISISRQQKKHTCPNKLLFAITFELIDHKWLPNPGRIARPIPANVFKFQQKPKSKAISCGVFSNDSRKQRESELTSTSSGLIRFKMSLDYIYVNRSGPCIKNDDTKSPANRIRRYIIISATFSDSESLVLSMS